MASFSKRTLKARAQRAVAAPIKAKLRPGRLIWSLASFAIETAMGRGEMLKLQLWHTNLADGYLDLPRSITKNRKSCLVPLSLRARRILATQPRTGETVFDTNVNTVKLGFKRAFERAGCVDLRLHDLRHEAISWRQLEKAEAAWGPACFFAYGDRVQPLHLRIREALSSVVLMNQQSVQKLAPDGHKPNPESKKASRS